MDWLKRNPLFAAILIASAIACLIQGWLIYSARERVRRAAVQLEAKRQERDWLARQSPAPTVENTRAIAADLAVAERRAVECRAALAGKEWLPAAPARSIDGYFALATFTEELRALATRERIDLRAEERFGFATYVNEGPGPDLLGPVHRQSVVMQHLLETLFEAHPRSLNAAKRERPLTEAQRAARRGGTSGGAEFPKTNPSGATETQIDFFEPEPRQRLTAPSVVDGDLYRVEFTGQTRVLRALLNSLATSPLPLFVRAVEVEPETADAVTSVALLSAVSAGAPSAPVPLVTQNFSKFVVVVECLDVAPAPLAVSP